MELRLSCLFTMGAGTGEAVRAEPVTSFVLLTFLLNLFESLFRPWLVMAFIECLLCASMEEGTMWKAEMRMP